jgi:tetratricopeptide (TPR) repeat protein
MTLERRPRAPFRRPPAVRAVALAALLGLASLAAARAALAQAVAAPLERGDQAYARGDLTGARAAFEQALAAEPGSFAALVWLARVESELGEDARGEEQRRLVGSAVTHARQAVKAAPDSAQGYVWLSVALGRQALKEGPKTRLALSREIKAAVDRAIELDPGIGRAYHVRGSWNRKIASLSFIERAAANTVLGGVPKGASMENAVRDFEHAVALEPAYVNHRLELGRTFMEMKRWADARRELDKALALPPTSSARDERYQAEARELLARLPKK